MPRKKSDPPFEEALAQLEEVVRLLENGDLPLEESLQKFSEGMALSEQCLKKLNIAEKKFEKILSVEEGKLIETALDLTEE